jgi:hypothetical protein
MIEWTPFSLSRSVGVNAAFSAAVCHESDEASQHEHRQRLQQTHVPEVVAALSANSMGFAPAPMAKGSSA